MNEWEYNRPRYSKAELEKILIDQARKFRVNRVIQIKNDFDIALQIIRVSMVEDGVIVYVK